jgi:protein-S-isoprenylcysteine O-methyltransferase Ste14
MNVILLIGAVLCIASGLILLYQTIKLFALVGNGSLAPWDAPKKLVVTGIYRHVRNPMHSGVFLILIGETLITGQAHIFLWCIGLIILHLFYIPLSEEEGLKQRFGESYQVYCQNVPRWIPRWTAWKASDSL